jgi:hypothetical protein
MNGAEFSAGDEVERPEAPHRQLRQEAESFGLWNPEAMARKLGFGDAEVVAGEEDDEDEDFLAEIMCNIGEFRLYQWESESRVQDALMVRFRSHDSCDRRRHSALDSVHTIAFAASTLLDAFWSIQNNNWSSS